MSGYSSGDTLSTFLLLGIGLFAFGLFWSLCGRVLLAWNTKLQDYDPASSIRASATHALLFFDSLISVTTRWTVYGIRTSDTKNWSIQSLVLLPTFIILVTAACTLVALYVLQLYTIVEGLSSPYLFFLVSLSLVQAALYYLSSFNERIENRTIANLGNLLATGLLIAGPIFLLGDALSSSILAANPLVVVPDIMSALRESDQQKAILATLLLLIPALSVFILPTSLLTVILAPILDVLRWLSRIGPKRRERSRRTKVQVDSRDLIDTSSFSSTVSLILTVAIVWWFTSYQPDAIIPAIWQTILFNVISDILILSYARMVIAKWSTDEIDPEVSQIPNIVSDLSKMAILAMFSKVVFVNCALIGTEITLSPYDYVSLLFFRSTLELGPTSLLFSLLIYSAAIPATTVAFGLIRGFAIVAVVLPIAKLSVAIMDRAFAWINPLYLLSAIVVVAVGISLIP